MPDLTEPGKLPMTQPGQAPATKEQQTFPNAPQKQSGAGNHEPQMPATVPNTGRTDTATRPKK